MDFTVSDSESFTFSSQSNKSAKLPQDFSGAVSYWPFEGTSGGRVVDSLTGNLGSPSTNVSYGPGKIGYAAYLPGSPDHIQLNDHTSNRIGSEWSISFFVCPSTNTTQRLIEKGTTAASRWEYGFLGNTSGSITFTVWQSNGTNHASVISNAPLNAGSWNHVVGTFSDNNFVRIYVNGSLNESLSAMAGVITPNIAPVQIGRRDNASQYMTGSIDAITYFNRVLTAGEIGSILNSQFRQGDSLSISQTSSGTRFSAMGSTGFIQSDGNIGGFIPSDISGCIRWFRFDEQSGTSVCYDAITGSQMTLFGSPLPLMQTGKFGNAIGFYGGSGGGAGSVIYGQMTPSLLPVSGDFTISAWINPGSYLHSDAGNVVMFRSFQRLSYHNNGSSSWSFNITSGATSTDKNIGQVKTPPGSWTHIVVVKEGISPTVGSAWCWVNGSQLTSNGTVWYLNASQTNSIFLGGYPAFASFQHLAYSGLVDNISVYDRKLTSGEIGSLYLGYIPPSDTLTFKEV